MIFYYSTIGGKKEEEIAKKHSYFSKKAIRYGEESERAFSLKIPPARSGQNCQNSNFQFGIVHKQVVFRSFLLGFPKDLQFSFRKCAKKACPLPLYMV